MARQSSADCVNMRSARLCVRRTRAVVRRGWLRGVAGRSGFCHWLTLLCLGLVLLSGTIQAEHVHAVSPGSVDTHAACSLCVTAHAGVEIAGAPMLPVAARLIGQAEPRRVEPTFPALRNFDLFTRPPPADPTPA